MVSGKIRNLLHIRKETKMSFRNALLWNRHSKKVAFDIKLKPIIFIFGYSYDFDFCLKDE